MGVLRAPGARPPWPFLPCDYGDGFCKRRRPRACNHTVQGLNHVGVLIPLDLPGSVARQAAGQDWASAPLPQGEVFFDDVRVPAKYALSTGQETAIPQFVATLTFANMEMAATFTGVARSAFDLALDYVHERKQGGTAIINHQSVQSPYFRPVAAGGSRPRPHASECLTTTTVNMARILLGSVTSKTFATRTSFEVASEALQLFGGNGLTREYPIEKIMRDARASMIEDGENNVLNLKGMTLAEPLVPGPARLFLC